MYRVAYAILQDSDDAQDAVQDAVTHLWEKRKELTAVNDYEAFCVTAVKRRCIDLLRKRNYRQAMTTSIVETIEDDGDISSRLETRDTLTHVMKIVENLPANQREVLRLRSQGDCSLQEIAEITGLTNSNARTLLSRARKKLKELIHDTK